MTQLTRRTVVRAALGAATASPLASRSRTVRAAGKEEWEEVVAAANKEGALSLLTWGDTWGGAGYPAVVKRFQQAFPGIAVTWLPEDSADTWLSWVRQERQSGIYAFDLALVQPDAALITAAKEGFWAPLEPHLLRPDVRDDASWREGFAARFLDTAGNACFSWEFNVIHAYAVNTDFVAKDAITSVKDLLQAKWTGKIISSDPRLGLGLSSAAAVAKSSGADLLRQLLVDQQPALAETGQELVEALIQGRYPIALGVRPKALDDYLQQGLGKNVAFLDLPDADFAATTPLLLFDRAPHPAAAALFANWILTQEGQTILTSSLPTNSARTDVKPFVQEGIASAGKSYYEPDREANFAHTAKTQTFITSLLGAI